MIFGLAMVLPRYRIILTAVEVYVRHIAEDIRDVKVIVNDGNSRLELLDQRTRENHSEAKELHAQTTSDIREVAAQLQKERVDNEQEQSSKWLDIFLYTKTKIFIQTTDESKRKLIQWLSTIDPTTD